MVKFGEESAPESASPPASLLEFVLSALRDGMGMEPVRISEFEFAVPRGSSLTRVQVLSEPESVRFWSVMVDGVPASPALFKALNDINARNRFGCTYWSKDQISIDHHLLPHGLSKEEIMTALHVLTSTADTLDHMLQQEFGGKIFGRERKDDEVEV